MFINRKTNTPSLFMHFGVDQRGVLVPFLRRVRGEVLQVKRTLGMLSVRTNTTLRHQ